MYDLGYLTEKLPLGRSWLYVQIFLSGPGLIILGSMLFLKYAHSRINEILGPLLILIGLYWLYTLASGIVAEAA